MHMSETGGQQRFVLLGESYLNWIHGLPQSVTQWVPLTRMMSVWFVKIPIVTILLEFTFMRCRSPVELDQAVKSVRYILHYALFSDLYTKIWYVMHTMYIIHNIYYILLLTYVSDRGALAGVCAGGGRLSGVDQRRAEGGGAIPPLPSVGC